MSRSPAIVHFADSAVLYGLWDNAKVVLCRELYATSAERDAAWERWHEHIELPNDIRQCDCAGEECILLDQQYEPTFTHVYVGTACREHGYFLGMKGVESDSDTPPELDCALRCWNSSHDGLRAQVRANRFKASRAFRPLLVRVAQDLMGHTPLPVPLDEIVVWTD